MKICVVCGYSAGDSVRECPNCGSYDFRTTKSKETHSRFKRWK